MKSPIKRLLAWATGAGIVASLAGACGGGDSAGDRGSGGRDAGGSDTSVIVPPDGGGGGNGSCRPQTCADLGVTCGPQGDGCGNVIQCGTCTAPEVCGAGGPSQCGVPNPNCVKKTCAQLNANCGPQGDGCGGVLQCGTCTTAGQFCGGGGPSRCGVGTGSIPDAGACVKTKTACAPGDCGPIADGCGGTIACATTCPAGQRCGGAGVPSRCGGSLPDGGGVVCQPRACPANTCGQQSNGCGGLTPNCGSCPTGQICGGGGVPSRCGPVTDGGTGPCTGLCLQQVRCDAGGTTTLTGTVYAPNGDEPLPGAVVYVPNGGAAPGYGVQPFPAGVTCSRCGADVTGNPLVTTTSAFNGTFRLENVPVGANIPLVVQLGRWRRMTTVNVGTACGNNAAPAASTRLPRTQGEFGVVQNNIPLTAIATGGVDTLECVLRKIGVADSEFTSPTAGGRIHLWRGDDGPEGYGQRPPQGDAVSWSGLYGSQAALDRYDQLIFACNGDPGDASMENDDRARVLSYLNKGGRLLASHYEYVWLNNFAPFSGTARWNVDQARIGNQSILGNIDTSFPKGQLFAQWLGAVGALDNVTPPRIEINVSRHDLDPLPNPPGTGVVPPAQRWISVHNTLPNGDPFPSRYDNNDIRNYVGAPQHYTFNTPVGVPDTQQCGRVLFSDFHVSNASSNNVRFPDECDDDPLSPQEKVIEFMLFDLGNCITPDAPPPTCTRRTCQSLGANCGQHADGCGGLTANCGTCVNGQTCGGGGNPLVCGGPTCTPRTCPANFCGPMGDGCGGLINCNCPTGQACGAGGVPNRCARSTCTPRTCQQMGVTCGPSGDGCGNLIQCGNCPSNCTPRTCAQAGANCGKIGDNCGGLVDCGVCPPGTTCGGDGRPNVCSVPVEIPQ